MVNFQISWDVEQAPKWNEILKISKLKLHLWQSKLRRGHDSPNSYTSIQSRVCWDSDVSIQEPRLTLKMQVDSQPCPI